MSDNIEIIVGKSGNDMRLEMWLPENVPGLSRNKANEMIKKGLVKVNDDNGNKGRKLKEGQKVTVILEKTAERHTEQPTVLFENEELVIVNKPAGMPCHPLRLGEIGTLLDWVAERYPEVRKAGTDEREGGLLHRLDVDTSGAVAFARNRDSFDKLKPLFLESGADKYYLAVVEDKTPGLPEIGKSKTIDIPLARHPSKAGRMIAVISGKEQKRGDIMPARTEIRTLAKGNGCALIEAKISRGRMHQIRLHLATIGHPIIGDAEYGKKDGQMKRHALHAYRLVLGKIDITAPLPDDIKKLCETRKIDLNGF